jgi:hypothetical protein
MLSRCHPGVVEGAICMHVETLLFEMMLSGFFAIACIRAISPECRSGKSGFSSLWHFPGRIERLRRSRWQWFSMATLLLVIRLQRGTPFVLEATAGLMFILFIAMPGRSALSVGVRRR